jgi:hypothetical protein
VEALTQTVAVETVRNAWESQRLRNVAEARCVLLGQYALCARAPCHLGWKNSLFCRLTLVVRSPLFAFVLKILPALWGEVIPPSPCISTAQTQGTHSVARAAMKLKFLGLGFVFEVGGLDCCVRGSTDFFFAFWKTETLLFSRRISRLDICNPPFTCFLCGRKSPVVLTSESLCADSKP